MRRVSLDADVAEERLGLMASEGSTPELLLDRAWALTLRGRAFDRLAHDEAAARRSSTSRSS